MDQPEDFSQWLSRTQAQRDALFLYAKSELPTDAGARTHDIDKSLRASEAAGRQLAEIQFFLTQETAKSTVMARESSPDLSVKERDIQVKDAVKEIQRLYDYIDVLTRTLNSRVRVSCNARRSIL